MLQPAMPPIDHTAEYYRLREGHERALALAARGEPERNRHLETAALYRELSRGKAPPFDGTGLPASQGDSSPPGA
jgi:hypothetical protein